MSLEAQQEIMIRLCLEKDLHLLFLNQKAFRDILLEKIGGELFTDNDIKGISFQLNTIDILLLNDLKANLLGVFSQRVFFDELEKMYDNYRLSFPYRFRNKLQEYIRFLGFLLYSLDDDMEHFDLKNAIKAEYSIFLCSLKRERLVSDLFLIKNLKGSKCNYVINPTLVVLSFKKSPKLNRSAYTVFFYNQHESELSIAEIDKTTFKFLKKYTNSIISEDEVRRSLSIKELDFSKDIIVESGLLLLV